MLKKGMLLHAIILPRQKYQHDFNGLRQERHVSLTLSGGGAHHVGLSVGHSGTVVIEVFGRPSTPTKKVEGQTRRQSRTGGEPSDAGSVP